MKVSLIIISLQVVPLKMLFVALPLPTISLYLYLTKNNKHVMYRYPHILNNAHHLLTNNVQVKSVKSAQSLVMMIMMSSTLSKARKVLHLKRLALWHQTSSHRVNRQSLEDRM